MWQDLVLSVGQLLFSLALIPALRSHEKPPRSTCFLTGGALLCFALAYFTLNLWYSGASAALCGGLWLWLGAQARLELGTLAHRELLIELWEAALQESPDYGAELTLYGRAAAAITEAEWVRRYTGK